MVDNEVQQQRGAGLGNHGGILRCREWPSASKLGERTDLAFFEGQKGQGRQDLVPLKLLPRTHRRRYAKLNANY